MNVQLAETKNSYAAAFHESMQRDSDEPAWLRQTREHSFDRFQRLGFPTVAEEEWKYTNVAPIAKSNFLPFLDRNGGAIVEPSMLAASTYEEARESRLVFVNGVFRKDLSATGALPAGVVAVDFAEAARLEQSEAVIRGFLNQDDQNGFAALNVALFPAGVFLKIPREVVVQAPIHLLFLTAQQNGYQLAAFPRVLIHAESGSAATLIESYSGAGAYLTDSRIDIAVEDGARITHYKLQRESGEAFHIATTRAALGRDSFYGTTSINLGGKLSRHNIDVLMDHEGAECAVDGLYMVEGSQHTDTHSVIDHRQPHCTSRQLYKGILDGKSRAVFNGKVFVRHGAQQTDAQQTNKNLLLSSEAQIDTKPQLEIYADDVKCTHGAAVGQLAADELFYLESRGINPSLARNMLTYGFAEEVIERIKIESIKRELDEAVLNRLHSDLSIES